MNTYNIPINFIKKTGLKIKAINETEAIKEAEHLLENYYSEDNMNLYGVPEIQKDKITCEQDEEMIENLVRDVSHLGNKDFFNQTFIGYKDSNVELKKLDKSTIQFCNNNGIKCIKDTSNIKVYLNDVCFPDTDIYELVFSKELILKIKKDNPYIFNIHKFIQDIVNENKYLNLKIICPIKDNNFKCLTVFSGVELISTQLISRINDKNNEYRFSYEDKIDNLYFINF